MHKQDRIDEINGHIETMSMIDTTNVIISLIVNLEAKVDRLEKKINE